MERSTMSGAGGGMLHSPAVFPWQAPPKGEVMCSVLAHRSQTLAAAWFLLGGLAAATLHAQPPDLPSTFNGWRGNATGLWPEADVPTTWSRLPHGALEGLCASAEPPADPTAAGPAEPVSKGYLRHWLVLGPFPVENALAQFDEDLLAGEAAQQPAAGDVVAGRTWTALAAPAEDIFVFGRAEPPWLDLGAAVGFAPNQFVYAHTYLYSPRGGPAEFVIDHGHGLKLWLNGDVVYRHPERQFVLGGYPGLSRHELEFVDPQSGRCDVQLQPGWNRLLLKLSSDSAAGFAEMRVHLRLLDPPDVAYESHNVRWLRELPARSTSTPILVGERLFLMAEPCELLCLDARTGALLWRAENDYYAALTHDERDALGDVVTQVDPLVQRMQAEPDRAARWALRGETQRLLQQLAPDTFQVARDGHFDAHFGIVGYTMPTPVSDGRFVYVWCGQGVAACYDLAGDRQWITRVPTGPLTYGSSPALADGVLCVFLEHLRGLDARTGELLWEQHAVQRNVGAVQAALLSGRDVFVTQRGEVVRPADGELLYRPRGASDSGDTGWAPPTILGDLVYQPRYGVAQLNVLDFSGIVDDWREPQLLVSAATPEDASRGPDGGWLDRWTAGSPLIWDGLAYVVDIYQELFVLDLATGALVYRQKLPLDGYMHYNAVPVAASPALLGAYIYVCDNQGNTVVFEPGRAYKEVAVNRLHTQLARSVPLPGQETLAYAPPIVLGDAILLRGERHLYCLGRD